MGDINFLSEDMQKREEKERRKKNKGKAGKEKEMLVSLGKKEEKQEEVTLLDVIGSLFRRKKQKEPKILEERVVEDRRPAQKKEYREQEGVRKEEKGEKAGKGGESLPSSVFPNGRKEPASKLKNSQQGVQIPETAAKPAGKGGKGGEKKDTPIHMAEEGGIGGVEVNLLPEEIIERQRVKSHFMVLLAAVFGSLVMVLFVGGLGWMELNSLKAELATETAALRFAEEQMGKMGRELEKEQDIVSRLSVLPSVLQERHYWSRFLDKVESVTLKTVYLPSFTAQNEAVEFEVSAPDWQTAARQLSIWESKQEWWSTFRVNDARQVDEGGAEGAASPRPGQELVRSAKRVIYAISLSLSPSVWEDDL